MWNAYNTQTYRDEIEDAQVERVSAFWASMSPGGPGFLVKSVSHSEWQPSINITWHGLNGALYWEKTRIIKGDPSSPHPFRIVGGPKIYGDPRATLLEAVEELAIVAEQAFLVNTQNEIIGKPTSHWGRTTDADSADSRNGIFHPPSAAQDELQNLVAAVRPTLQVASTTPAQRAQLVYDLVREVYDHVKFDVYGPDVDSAERARLGAVLNEALPPTSHDLRGESEEL